MTIAMAIVSAVVLLAGGRRLFRASAVGLTVIWVLYLIAIHRH